MEMKIDQINELVYNAKPKEKEMQKETSPITLEQKRRAVVEITQKHEDLGIPIPQACKEQGIKIYTYYNWKKRVEQLAAKRRKSVTFSKLPVQTSPTIMTIPKDLPSGQKCVVIMADANDLSRVLQQLF